MMIALRPRRMGKLILIAREYTEVEGADNLLKEYIERIKALENENSTLKSDNSQSELIYMLEHKNQSLTEELKEA